MVLWVVGAAEDGVVGGVGDDTVFCFAEVGGFEVDRDCESSSLVLVDIELGNGVVTLIEISGFVELETVEDSACETVVFSVACEVEVVAFGCGPKTFS